MAYDYENVCDLLLEDGTIIKAEERIKMSKEFYCLNFLDEIVINNGDRGGDN